jgi:hypothetical protein
VTDNGTPSPVLAPMGCVEPHAPLLRAPPDGQLLYKIMKAEHLLGSVEGGYLHFNRVNAYSDFPNADLSDGQQLPRDLPGNEMLRFGKAPDFSAANYYDGCRARTYACCFSLEDSAYIWTNYANASAKGKVGVVFDFAKMRAAINRIMQPGNAGLLYNGVQCRQIFSVNYGIVDYVDWDSHRANETRLPNPIIYTYLKDRKRFSEEKELRVSLSAIGMGHFILHDGSRMDFPPSLHLPFDYRSAFADGTIQQILLGPDCDLDYLHSGMRALGVAPADGSDLQGGS